MLSQKQGERISVGKTVENGFKAHFCLFRFVTTLLMSYPRSSWQCLEEEFQSVFEQLWR
jgi:hypothetical protein